MTDPASVDMSAALRAWHRDPCRKTAGITSWVALAKLLGVNADRLRRWSETGISVPAEYIANLCRLTGIPEPAIVAPPRKRCAMPLCRTTVSPPWTQCLVHRREVKRLDQRVAAMEPSTVVRNPYVGTCSLCSRQPKDWFLWTVEQYRTAKPQHCETCGGRLWVEAVPLTRIGSMHRADVRVSA